MPRAAASSIAEQGGGRQRVSRAGGDQLQEGEEGFGYTPLEWSAMGLSPQQGAQLVGLFIGTNGAASFPPLLSL
jgi:hypothetical protein